LALPGHDLSSAWPARARAFLAGQGDAGAGPHHRGSTAAGREHRVPPVLGATGRAAPAAAGSDRAAPGREAVNRIWSFCMATLTLAALLPLAAPVAHAPGSPTPVAHAPGSPAATDWPGWRGPDRTGVSRETGLLDRWPKEGPKLLWKATELGGGYATPSVAGGKVFLMGSKGDEEFLFALDAATGKRLWSTRVGKIGENDGPNYPGPRAAPSVVGELLYALGSDGALVCARTDSGKVVWRRHLETDFGGKRGGWAYCESPLVDGDVVVCTPGGEKATMVALDRKTG